MLCSHCDGVVEPSFRFCPWCASPQRHKVVEFFAAAPWVDEDHGKALRVSRYLEQRHVRFSVWDESGKAESAVSLDNDEAARLASFLAPSEPARRSRVQDLIDRLAKPTAPR